MDGLYIGLVLAACIVVLPIFFVLFGKWAQKVMDWFGE